MTTRALDRIAQALEQIALELGDGHGPAALAPLPPVQPIRPAHAVEPVQALEPVQAVRPVLFDGCPVHHRPWKLVPAGISKRTGQAYEAFRACAVTGCAQRPPT